MNSRIDKNRTLGSVSFVDMYMIWLGNELFITVFWSTLCFAVFIWLGLSLTLFHSEDSLFKSTVQLLSSFIFVYCVVLKFWSTRWTEVNVITWCVPVLTLWPNRSSDIFRYPCFKLVVTFAVVVDDVVEISCCCFRDPRKWSSILIWPTLVKRMNMARCLL